MLGGPGGVNSDVATKLTKRGTGSLGEGAFLEGVTKGSGLTITFLPVVFREAPP